MTGAQARSQPGGAGTVESSCLGGEDAQDGEFSSCKFSVRSSDRGKRMMAKGKGEGGGELKRRRGGRTLFRPA